MIPKTIHYVWFSKDIPEKIQGYIDSWHKIMPDYKIIKWNRENFDIHSAKWIEQALEHNKFTYASDYVRLWVLYNHGGIYLDSDVKAFKPFDDLLNLPYFLGREYSKGIIEMATLGAEPKLGWVKDCLDYYRNKSFILPNGELSTMDLIPHVSLKILNEKYGLKRISSIQDFDRTSKKIQIFPAEFFSPKPWDSEKFTVTKNTYSVHYYEKSWNPPKKWYSELSYKVKHAVRKIIGEKRYLDFVWKIYVKPNSGSN
jgi:mannosyltransferase OCH1-like enzyme